MLYYERKLEGQGYGLIAGVDEAGRGPLAGPVVSAAVILKEKKFSSRIDDSKVLSPKQRQKAYYEIQEKAWATVGIISHNIIDKINILEATRLSMHKAISSLDPAPDFILVDGNISLNTRIPFLSIIKGDSKSLSVACASIVAKVTRDRIMRIYHKLYPDYGFFEHKGYGTEKHIEALRRIGPSPIHRLTFHYE